MGDRCSVAMTILHSEEKKILLELGRDQADFESDNGFRWKLIEFEDMNYGAYEERLALTRLGCTFFGHHGSGYEYPEAVFVAINGVHIDIEALDGEPVAKLNKSGKPSVGASKKVKAFYKMLAKAKKRMGYTAK